MPLPEVARPWEEPGEADSPRKPAVGGGAWNLGWMAWAASVWGRAHKVVEDSRVHFRTGRIQRIRPTFRGPAEEEQLGQETERSE